MKNILNEIETDIIDIKAKNFRYVSTSHVPSRHDTSLTFERGVEKVGKEIQTCVLYVDIRNSVDLNKRHHSQTMGRIYTVFSKSMLKIARYHNGCVRNIIGDRVMIVFPKENCYTNAVNCAISINHISGQINNLFTEVDFKCGIGIDYGNLKVVKVGLHRRGQEGFDNKNLVWVGYPANIASRLTDVANKTVENSRIKVSYFPFNLFFRIPTSGIFDLPMKNPKSLYSETPREEIVSNEEFAKKLTFNSESNITYGGGKLIRFDKIESKNHFRPILMTARVFTGFKSENPNRKCIKENLWQKIKNHNIKNVDMDVFEGNVTWKI